MPMPATSRAVRATCVPAAAPAKPLAAAAVSRENAGVSALSPTAEDSRARRALLTLVAFAILNHIVFNGSRIGVSLFAIRLGAAPVTIGILMGLYGLLPMFLSVSSGRLIDRIGVKTPMIAGSATVLVGALIVPVVPGLPTLFVASTLIGTGFMLFQIAQQNVAGYIGRPEHRALNFSLVALGFSISNFFGPTITGVLIDHVGFSATFGALGWLPAIVIVGLAANLLPLPQLPRAEHPHARKRLFDLLSHRELRYVYLTTGLTTMGWDLYTFVTPLYGSRIGLSATQIGLVIASFALATFIVRLAMPIMVRKFTPWQVLRAALTLSAAVYFLFPLTHQMALLIGLSFVLGLGLGSAQPMVMALLHAKTPEGRVGEAVGLRATLVNTSQTGLPLFFGALGGALGMMPVFWALAALQFLGSELVRRHSGRRPRDEEAGEALRLSDRLSPGQQRS